MTTPAKLFAGAGLAFFLILGGAIASGELLLLAERPDGSTALDSPITAWLVAHRAPGITAFARSLSTLGSQKVLLPTTTAVGIVLLRRRQFALGWSLVIAWGGPIGLYKLTKYAVDRHRPPVAISLTTPSGTSFPSGHALQSLSTMIAIAHVGAVWVPRTRRPGRTLALGLAAGVGSSRVYLGVHWATDVVAGWLIAAAWITIVTALRGPAKLLDQRRCQLL